MACLAPANSSAPGPFCSILFIKDVLAIVIKVTQVLGCEFKRARNAAPLSTVTRTVTIMLKTVRSSGLQSHVE